MIANHLLLTVAPAIDHSGLAPVAVTVRSEALAGTWRAAGDAQRREPGHHRAPGALDADADGQLGRAPEGPGR